MESEKGEWKSWPKAQHSENKDHGIRSHHFMANRWGNGGNSVRLYFWGSKITADGVCSHEIKRRLLLGREVMTNLDSILKSRDITLPTKFCLVKAVVFPVVMYGCVSWTIKKAESRIIDAFELRCCRRLLRVPWTARRSSQSILKEISPGCSSEWLILKLKLWPSHVKSWLIGKDPDAGRDLGQEEKGLTEGEMAVLYHQLNGHEFRLTPGVGNGREAWHAVIHGITNSRTHLSDWTELYWRGFAMLQIVLHLGL